MESFINGLAFETRMQNHLQKSLEVMNDGGKLPESYLANSKVANENTPLGWPQGMFLLVLDVSVGGESR